MAKRCFDVALAMICLILFALPTLLIVLSIRMTSKGPLLHWSHRVGKNNRRFRMPKFRTMNEGTPQMATHLMDDPERWVTPFGRWLRRLSLDELPQLWNILKGQMSFVGPRPALYNQADLIAARRSAGVDQLVPGLTGWAQINGRDDLSIEEKVRLDKEYLNRRSLGFDLKIIIRTIVKVIRQEGVRY